MVETNGEIAGDGPNAETDERALTLSRKFAAPMQVALAGLFAWSVTVVPAALTPAGGSTAKIFPALALVFLAGHVAATVRGAKVAWLASFWGFALSSALAWLVASTSASRLEFDATRGVAGMLGWTLFAIAVAAPSVVPQNDDSRVIAVVPAVPRRFRGDSIILSLGVTCAFALQLFGWNIAQSERALLVRLATLAAGLAIVGVASAVAQSSLRSSGRGSKRGLRDGLPALLLAVILFAVFFLVRR